MIAVRGGVVFGSGALVILSGLLIDGIAIAFVDFCSTSRAIAWFGTSTISRLTVRVRVS